MNTWKITLFIFCSKIHFFFHLFLLSFLSIKSQRRQWGLIMLEAFSSVQQDFIETPPREVFPSLFYCKKLYLWRVYLIWKSKHLTACQKQEGPALWDLKRFLCIWRNIPLIIFSSETEPRHSKHLCSGSCWDRFFCVQLIGPNLPWEEDLWEVVRTHEMSLICSFCLWHFIISHTLIGELIWGK